MKMDFDSLHMGIQVLAVLTGILSFSLLVIIARNYQPGQLMVRTYQRINNELRERKRSWFDYQKIQSFLDKNGASYHLGNKMDPIRYYAVNLTIAVLGIWAGARLHFLASIILSIIGFQAAKMYLLYVNKKDNEKLLPEIQLLFNALAVQIRSGVHVTDALAECYGSVTDKRMRNALMDLTGDIILKADVREALEHFEGKFDNRYIDSLCIIILQALESGQAIELLADISEQIKDMESIVLQKKKTDLDRKVTFYLLGVMTSILAVVIYACVMQMFTAAVQF